MDTMAGTGFGTMAPASGMDMPTACTAFLCIPSPTLPPLPPASSSPPIPATTAASTAATATDTTTHGGSGMLAVPWFHGRLFTTAPRREKPLALLAAQAAGQHACLTPADGSYVEYDGVLVDYEARRVARVAVMAAHGGTLLSLHPVAPPHDAGDRVRLTFEPASACSGDARAARLASRLFPDLAGSDGDGDGVTVVEGTATLTGLRTAVWLPLDDDSSGGAVVRALLAPSHDHHAAPCCAAAPEAAPPAGEARPPPTRVVVVDADGWTRVVRPS